MRVKVRNAPVAGWNARDGLDEMSPNEAIELKNWFPTETGVELRGGYTSHLDGLGDWVETLVGYEYEGTKKLIAASNGNIWDATTTASSLASGFTNNRWQDAFHSGNLILMNGADTARVYNGTGLASLNLTGMPGTLTEADIINGTNYFGRMWYLTNNSTSLLYTGIGSYQGAVTEFDYSDILTYGGHIVATGKWTRDAGDGLNDLHVIISSTGEVLIYGGDPSTTYSHLGSYKIGEPLGPRCIERYGADMVVMTRDGYLSMSQIISMGETAYNDALSDKIRGAITTATVAYGDNFGWQPIFYPRNHMLIFNVPVGVSTYEQHVLNTITGAWCRFTGQNARCWAIFDKQLYWGGDSEIFIGDSSTADDGQNIVGDCTMAFDYMDLPANIKQWTLIKPILKAAGFPADGIETDVDFTFPSEPSDGSLVGLDLTEWGSPWGSPWGASLTTQDDWCGIGDIGRCISLRFKLSSKRAAIWYSTHYMFKPGGVI